MFLLTRKVVFLSAFISALAISVLGQAKPGDGTPMQRLDVMGQKLTIMRRSLTSFASVLKDENKDDKSKKDGKDKVESPLGRILSLEKEAARLQTEVNDLRGKINRGDQYEISDVDSLEQGVSELQTRVDAAEFETAKARAAQTSDVGKPRDKKQKKKFLGIFGKSDPDEYEDLIGSVSPGRDRELFIVATREVRKKNYDVGRLLFQTIITTYPSADVKARRGRFVLYRRLDEFSHSGNCFVSGLADVLSDASSRRPRGP